ncbi:MAG: (2Fe-2S)-binding protein [Candidatus Synoicihabitans palmerolidicus]|nr:(2Fe-2S)-binding protein [Candidatus Synoicihabitans palmerolidicus]
MIQPAQPELVTVTIDGKEIAVPKGTNVIEAARLAGTDVPHYCYHPKLSVAGNCRMCLIELGMPMADRATHEPIMDPETGKQKIGWIPHPQIGCATNVVPGMQVKTQSPMVKECREGVMEFLLINHPLDCPICDQAGECKLQEQATGYGRGYSRFIEQKNVKPKRAQLGPRVTLDDERCVLCSRCIRFCQEVAKDDVLGFVDRGSYSTLTCYPGKELKNNYSLNTVDICPVGALTSTDFRFKMRVWFLKQTNSIDTESSVGANTVVWSREGVIYRITPRRNDEVNDTWMADSGRILYKQVQADDRLHQSTVKGQPATLAAVIADAAKLAKAGHVAVVGSGRSSVEEQFLTKRLATTLETETFVVGQTGEGDGLLISADRNPNTRGALVTGLVADVPTAQLDALGAEIDAGRVKTIISVGEDLIAAGLTPAQLDKVALIILSAHGTSTTAVADVVIPTLTVFEKNGTFINQQFRLQKFAQAIPGLTSASNDLVVLDELIAAVGGEASEGDMKSLWKSMGAEIPVFANITYGNLPATGLLLDSSAWDNLNFPEGETLHFKPAAAEASA